MFYLQKTVENGWSRAVLLNFLDTNLYERQGKAVNNFNKLLADPQSELAAQTLKDPYNFDFLTLDGEYRERELEQGLTQNVTRFLLELGTGFAFVGSQVPLQLGGRYCISRLAILPLRVTLLCGRGVESDKIQSRTFGTVGDVCECRQSYQEEAN